MEPWRGPKMDSGKSRKVSYNNPMLKTIGSIFIGAGLAFSQMPASTTSTTPTATPVPAVTASSIPSVNLSSIGTGDDILIGTGVSADYVARQTSSLSSLSIKVADLGGKPTYISTTYGLSFGSIANAVKTGNLTAASSALVIKAGITQVFWHPKPHWYFYCESQLGIVKFDWSTLGNASGSVGLAIDLGGIATHDKYHIYLSPLATEVSIASLQVKPSFGVQVLTGFKKN
jgi:hypothetical protein